MTFPARTALIAAFLALSAPAQAAEVPTLDVSPTCRPLPGADVKIDTDRCLKTEREARDQLERQWVDFPAGDRKLCTQRAAMAGMPSYVELITCLEMKREAARLPADALTTRPSALRR